MKKTRWFPASQKPDQTGVYERKMPPRFGQFSYWNGTFWGGWAQTPEMAEENKQWASMDQSLDWRGLARKP